MPFIERYFIYTGKLSVITVTNMIEGIKESRAGRIVSQKSAYEETPLLKRYDTEQKFYNIKYDRIKELKSKYNNNNYGTPIQTQYQQPESLPPKISTQFKQVVQKMKNKYEHRQQPKKQNISQFTNQVQAIDIRIDEKLCELEGKLKFIRDLGVESQRKQNSYYENVNKQYPSQKKSEKQGKECQIEVASSENSMEGRLPEYPREYIHFLQTIRLQIDLDISFTNLLLSVPSSRLPQIRHQLTLTYPQIDPSYFQLTTMQIDPLLSRVTQPYASEHKLMQQLYKKYSRMEQHYRHKLFRAFNTSTINTFLQQLDSPQISLGHFISYLNLKCARNYRNRSIVKLMRRINICTAMIDPRQLYAHFTA